MRNKNYTKNKKSKKDNVKPSGVVTGALQDRNAIARRKQLNTYFNFNLPVGSRFDVDPQKGLYGTPGIMTMYFTPSFGFNNDANTEIQNALDNFYREIRRFQTADATYTSTDLMLYILAAEQIYSWITYISRAYNLICSSAYQNKYAGRALTIASGFDYDSLKSQTSALLDVIDEAVNTMASFALPPELQFVKRQQYLLANVFTDNENDPQAQLYMFNPRTFFQLYEQTDEHNVVTWSLQEIANPLPYNDTVYHSHGLVKGRNLSYSTASNVTLSKDLTEIIPSKLTLDQIKSVTNNMLNAFRNQKFNFDDMNGDIYRVYGASALRSWTPLTVGRAWYPIHDEAIDTMIENATLVGHLDYRYTKLTENGTGEILISNPCLAQGDYNSDATNPAWSLSYNSDTTENTRYKVLAGSRLLNFHKQDPTPEDMLWATRMCNVVEKGSALLYPNETRLKVVSAGTEILEFALVWVFDYANSQSYNSIIAYTQPIYYNFGLRLFFKQGVESYTFDKTTSVTELIKAMDPVDNALGFIETFKHHPILAKQTTIHGEDKPESYLSGTQVSYIVELDNWTVLNPEQIIRLTNVDLSEAFVTSSHS